jgi:hypothetical protein
MTMSVHLRATYEDGFVLIEDELDQSPYDEGRNIFHAIRESRPCADHGALVEFALITPGQPFAVDWTKVPKGALPVRERHMEVSQVGDVLGDAVVVGITFGFEYEVAGETVREVIEVQ